MSKVNRALDGAMVADTEILLFGVRAADGKPKKPCVYHPIAVASQRYLRLAIGTGDTVCHLQFRALPFQLSSAPRIFTKIMEEALAPLRIQGITIVLYLDYLLLFANSKEQLLTTNLSRTQWHLLNLGWLLNKEKSNLVPTQVMWFLGNTIDLIQQKRGKFLGADQTSLLVTVWSAISAIGFLTSSIPAVQWARELQQIMLLRETDHNPFTAEEEIVVVEEPVNLNKS